MPFQVGNKLNVGSHRGGRKGFEYEQKQLLEMKKQLNKFIRLANLIFDGKATPLQKDSFERLKPFILKIMDKLHATKTQSNINVDPVQIQISRKYD